MILVMLGDGERYSEDFMNCIRIGIESTIDAFADEESTVKTAINLYNDRIK